MCKDTIYPLFWIIFPSMALFQKHILKSGAQIVIWEITESGSEEVELAKSLSFRNKEMYEAIASTKRKREFLFTRLLLEKELGLIEVILYTDAGAPILSGNEISISHSGNFVALGLSQSQIGIDVQIANPKIARIAHKFVNEAEMKFIQTDISLSQQTLIWSAKEALYKLDAAGGLIFKEQLHIAPFAIENEFQSKGKITKNNTTRNCQLNIWHNINYSLVIAEDEI